MSRSFLRKKEASGVFLSDRVKQERVSYMKRNVKREVFEKIIETIFLICALVGVVSVAAIIVFVFCKGLHPFFGADAYSFWDFLSGTRWAPSENVYGIFYMIAGFCAGYRRRNPNWSPHRTSYSGFHLGNCTGQRSVKIIKPAVELLAGIPVRAVRRFWHWV